MAPRTTPDPDPSGCEASLSPHCAGNRCIWSHRYLNRIERCRHTPSPESIKSPNETARSRYCELSLEMADRTVASNAVGSLMLPPNTTDVSVDKTKARSLRSSTDQSRHNRAQDTQGVMRYKWVSKWIYQRSAPSAAVLQSHSAEGQDETHEFWIVSRSGLRPGCCRPASRKPSATC